MERKDRGIFRLQRSFKYAGEGLKFAYKHEQTVWIYIPVAITVIILGFILKISQIEWLILILILGLIYSLELINTALEKCVDLVTDKYHPLAKASKDIVSASVLIFAITSIICGLIIFVPKIIELF